MNASEVKHVVVLVHGTFAGGASWTAPDSPLARAAIEALGESAVARAFRWSGRNSHRARLKAGAELASYLKRLQDTHLFAQQHIVAHSHGGNVVAYALRDPEAQNDVRSVVCLGTPFILAHPRKLDETLRLGAFVAALGAASLALVLGCVVLMIGLLVSLSVVRPVIGALLTLLASALFWLVARLGLRGARHFKDSVVPRLRDEQRRITESLQASFGRTPVLSLRAQGDEAARYLRLVDGVARLPFGFWSPTVVLWVVALCTIAALFLFGGLASESIRTGREDPTELAISLSGWYALLLFGAALMLVLLAGAAQMACLLWPKLFRGHALGFGEWGFKSNYLVAISASRLPFDPRAVTDELLRVRGRGLNHSLLCLDGQALSAIASWLGRFK